MKLRVRVTKSTSAALICAAFFVSCGAFAKSPSHITNRSDLDGPHIGSLTPPPKEWAMFPQDEPPPQQAQNPQQGNPNSTNNSGNMVSGSANTGGIDSAHARSGHQKELPLLWLLVTGALSLGAAVACGSLILRKDQLADEDQLPTVSEVQEVA